MVCPTVRTGAYLSGPRALDDSPFHEFSIVLEAGVKILLGAGKLGNGHLDSSRRCINFR
jgi:hypothetical protein